MTRRTLAGVAIGGAAPTRLMAVLNVSPESFYRGSVTVDAAAIARRARRFVDEGADFIDVGAMSTAPYLDTHVDEEEERLRMTAAVEAVAASVEVPVSADTSRASVARAALQAGAQIVNDVSGLRDPDMVAAAVGAAGVVLMAAPERVVPPVDGDPIDIVGADLRAALDRARKGGVSPERIVVDPGLGFYTRTAWSSVDFNTAVLRQLGALRTLGYPILVGISRKSFIGKITGRADPADRLAGSLAATAIAVRNGASIVRTHDVAATRDAVLVARSLMD
jgi:dihydropteroate synthase